MKIQKFGSDLQELNFEQASEINGGVSVWYYVGYAIGGFTKGLEAFANGASEGRGMGK